MFDRRPTAADRRFDEDLECVLRGEWSAQESAAGTEDLLMARLFAARLAPLQELSCDTRERVWHDVEARVDARPVHLAWLRLATTGPRRKLVAAATAVALVVAGASPLGQQALVAAQDAAASMLAAVPGVRIDKADIPPDARVVVVEPVGGDVTVSADGTTWTVTGELPENMVLHEDGTMSISASQPAEE